jgi:hypothetical protein
MHIIKPQRMPVKQNNVQKPVVNQQKPNVQQVMSLEERKARIELVKKLNYEAEQRKLTKIKAGVPEYSGKRGVPNYKYGSVRPIWKGETVYIVAGGPSLKDFDFSKLKDKKVIAVNKAFMFVPECDVIYWTDTRFYNWYKKEIDAISCLKYTPSPHPINLADDVILLRNAGGRILDLTTDKITAGNNSGFGALSLALKMGAAKIYLLGYDMGFSGNKTHFHDGYPITSVRESIYKSMLKYFEDNVDIIKSIAKVYNTNRTSNLRYFNFCTIEEALASS